MRFDARGVIARTLALATLVVGAGRTAGGAAQDARLLHENLNAQFSSWLGISDHTEPYRAAIPTEIDVRSGRLEFPAPMTPRWVLKIPQVRLGDRKEPALNALRELLRTYLTADGRQALESVPENLREETLKELIANADVQIDDGNASPKVNPPPLPIVQATEFPPLASEQSLSHGGSYPAFPSGQVLGNSIQEAGPVAEYVPTSYRISSPLTAAPLPGAIESHVNPYELYWSGNVYGAASQFRVVTASNPEDATAWYFQALAELAVGDPITAQSTLRKAAATEARMKSSRQVSFALTRIQGPVRDWVEAARRAPATQPVQTLTAR